MVSFKDTIKILLTHPTVYSVPSYLIPAVFDAEPFIDWRFKQFLGTMILHTVVNITAVSCPIAGFTVAQWAKIGIVEDLIRCPDDTVLIPGIGEIGVINVRMPAKPVQ